MKKHFGSPWSIVLLLGRLLFALAIFWIIVFLSVQLGQRALGGWPATEIGQLFACGLGVPLAFRMRAPVVGYLLAAMAAFSASELAIHSVYGIRAAQGAATHFAVIGAGVLGVALGALLTRRNGRGPASYPTTVTHASLANPAGSTRDTDGATSQQRSNMPLQPMSSARRTSRFEPTISAARG